MSFHEIPRRRPAATLGMTMTAALYRSGGGLSFRLLLGRDLLQSLGWSEAVRARLLFGEGRDLGRGRLQRTDDGGSKMLRPARNRPESGCLVFSTQRLPAAVKRRPHGAVPVEYAFAEGALEFRVPDWFYREAGA